MVAVIPHFINLAVFLFVTGIASSQEILGVGRNRTPARLAPGLVTTVFTTAPDSLPPITNATGFPLPRSLAGFAVEFWFGSSRMGPPLLAPILSVRRSSSCPSSRIDVIDPCSVIANITIQVPWETRAGVDGALQVLMTISSDGRRSKFSDVSILQTQAAFPVAPDVTLISTPSTPPVRHLNGELVTYQNPARPGEVLSAYMLGLGESRRRLSVTGEPSPRGEDLEVDLRHEFRWTPSFTLVAPLMNGAGDSLNVLYAGLVPGSIGLYQINFVVPPFPEQTQQCSSQTHGNMTIGFAAPSSQDAISICVAP